MASILDFFTPGNIQGQALPDQQAASQIGTFMNDPRALGALLSFGVNMMNPSWGTPASKIANAVGSAGESVNTAEEQARKERETSSKEELRAAQASNQEARAGAAGARMDAAAQRLALEQFKQGNISDRANLQTRVRALTAYQTYRKQLNDANLVKPPKEQEAPMSWEEYTARHFPGVFGTGGAGEGEQPELPGGAGQTQSLVPQATAGQTNRPPGVYQTPKGPMRWTGTGWVAP